MSAGPALNTSLFSRVVITRKSWNYREDRLKTKSSSEKKTSKWSEKKCLDSSQRTYQRTPTLLLLFRSLSYSRTPKLSPRIRCNHYLIRFWSTNLQYLSQVCSENAWPRIRSRTTSRIRISSSKTMSSVSSLVSITMTCFTKLLSSGRLISKKSRCKMTNRWLNNILSLSWKKSNYSFVSLSMTIENSIQPSLSYMTKRN